jgi:putative transposase
LADARTFCEAFFGYYNHEHRHSGIGLHIRASAHRGTAPGIRAQRQHTRNAVHAAHPERFGNRRPQAPELSKAAWISQHSSEAPHTSHTAGR